MKKVKLYAATSLDGMIADKDGDVSWLDKIPNPEKTDYGYGEFYASVDTTVMGNTTYQQIIGFDVEFPYPNTKNFVFTRNTSHVDNSDVQFIASDPFDFIAELKNGKGKDIWLIGGGELNKYFAEHQLIDELILFIMPIVLGDGIPLFGELTGTFQMKMTEHEAYQSGVVKQVFTMS